MAKLENSSTLCGPTLVVAAVALVSPSGQVLMHQRSLSAVHGGLWEFPGGKVEPGETPQMAAAREMAEELGVQIDPDSLHEITFAAGRTVPDAQSGESRPLVILLFTTREWSGEPQLREGNAFDWVEPRAIASLAMPELDYPLAAGLIRVWEKISLPESDKRR